SKKLIKILQSLNFTLDHSTGSHFIFYNPLTKKRAVVPCHNKDLLKGTLISILKEAGISKEDFKKFLI
ncbi:MAG: type II toxin-antitoxin system HicA family toxin, partial [Candidatus Staskawiczbacteria bacterium]|nr:type II toxin-antitoxin system HicA family toxin [Candidatus Staskawiczbacteria bacterium]